MRTSFIERNSRIQSLFMVDCEQVNSHINPHISNWNVVHLVFAVCEYISILCDVLLCCCCCCYLSSIISANLYIRMANERSLKNETQILRPNRCILMLSLQSSSIIRSVYRVCIRIRRNLMRCCALNSWDVPIINHNY